MRLRVAWLWLLCAWLPLAPAWAQGDSADGEEAAVAHKIEVAADEPDGAPVTTDPLTDDGRKVVPIDPRAAEGPAPGVLAPANSAPPENPAFTPARPDGLPFTCEAAGVVDVATGQILYGNDLTKRLHPASTTKILTTLLALEAIEAGEVKMSDMVAISQTARETPESALWFWPGERMTLHDLLIGVMVRSANDLARGRRARGRRRRGGLRRADEHARRGAGRGQLAFHEPARPARRPGGPLGWRRRPLHLRLRPAAVHDGGLALPVLPRALPDGRPVRDSGHGRGAEGVAGDGHQPGLRRAAAAARLAPGVQPQPAPGGVS